MAISPPQLLFLDKENERFTYQNHTYYFGRLLGKGAFGKIYSVKNNNDFVVKVIPIKNKRHYTIIQQEISLTRHFNHINVIHNFASHYEQINHTYHILYERIDGHSLAYYIKLLSKSLPDSIDKKSLFSIKYYLSEHILNGLNYIHKQAITHRDIKPNNIMIHHDFTAKIIDFGLSKRHDKNKGLSGTKLYHAPEVFNKQNHQTSQIDMWSLGCTLFILYFGYHPLKAQKNHFLKNNASHNQTVYHALHQHLQHLGHTTIDQKPWQCIVSFIIKLLEWDPAKRLTIQQACDDLKMLSVKNHLLSRDTTQKKWSLFLRCKDPSHLHPQTIDLSLIN